MKCEYCNTVYDGKLCPGCGSSSGQEEATAQKPFTPDQTPKKPILSKLQWSVIITVSVIAILSFLFILIEKNSYEKILFLIVLL